MKLFRGIPIHRIIIDISFSCIWALMNAIFANTLANTITNNINNQNNLIDIMIYFIIFIISWELIEFIADIYITLTSSLIECNINKFYFNKLYKINPSILKENNTGYISGLLNKLVVKQENAYKHIVVNVPISIVYIIYFTIKMWQLHPYLGISLFSTAMIGNLFRFLVNTLSEKNSIALAKAEGDRNKLIVDVVSNINTVQRMQSLNFMNNNIDIENKKCIKATKKWSFLEELEFCGCKMIVFLYTPFAIFIYEMLPKGTIDTSTFLALLSVVSIQLVHNSKSLATSITHYNKFKGSLIKLEEIIKKENIRKDLFDGKFENLKIKNLIYTYKDKNNNENSEKIVTINIPSFDFNKNDKICIYGESGQGKTTLLNIVSGEINTDKVYINNIVNDKRLECVFIAQDTEMFDMSLRDNLTLGKNIPDEKLINFIEKVGMKDWFDSQEKRLDTMLGERGVFVSTGQRQRFNLIRGLLIDDKEIYLLDEPTSNVDEEVEESMINLIKDTLKDKTVLIVTHRPKINKICNKIYKFENSTINLEKYEKNNNFNK